MNIKEFWYKNGPTILTGAGIVGLFGTAFAVYKATPKWTKWKAEHPNVDKKEKIKTAVKLYLPAALIATGSTICILGSHAQSRKIQSSLAGALSVTAAGYKKYRDVVKKTIGEAEEAKIREAITDELIDELGGVPDNLNPGMSLYFEPISEQWFEATREDIYRAEKEFNVNFNNFGWVTINVFLDALGLEPYVGSDIIGYSKDDIYWDPGFIDHDNYISIGLIPAIDDVSGQEYFIIDYESGEPFPVYGIIDPFI